MKLTTLIITFLVVFGASTGKGQSSAFDYLKAIETTYKNAKILAFDGNIKYYTGIQNTNPSEVMLMSYRRDGEKVQIVIGDQTVIYDGKLNIIVNEGEKTIYVSSKQPKSSKKGLPTDGFEQYLKTGLFDVQTETYLGEKRKMSILSKDKNTTGSTVEFIYQPTTNFIEFSRMIIDRGDDETISEDINKKKFECSYYNYKTTLAEKITTQGYIEKVKTGKTTSFKGVGKFKDFQIITI